MEYVKKFNSSIFFHTETSGDDKFSFYEHANLFIFPPRKPEGHPWVIVEAMAAGLPIISTDQGAISEAVLNGENGYIVESYRPDQIAERVLFLMRNKDLCEQMGKNSRYLYEKNFTEEQMVKRLSQAIDFCLEVH